MMRDTITLLTCFLVIIMINCIREDQKQYFPDGTEITDWFRDTLKVNPSEMGYNIVITDLGAVNDSSIVQTKIIQNAIDDASKQGGGVIIIPKGTFLSGALFFKPNTHLHLSAGAVLKGSDNISDYPLMKSRMEGQNLDYFPALINAYGVDGFTISGKGTIDGNGLKYWESFWARRKENPACTNLEVSRPRLIFIWNCDNVRIQDVSLHNSGFWTSHYYKCSNVKIMDLHIFSPHQPVRAPSTDAIDIDACVNVHVKGCYMSVNDDAIALKGGKGPWADADTSNGANINILIEDCEFGFCHSALTCGSESVHNRNVLMRNCHINEAMRLLWLKMRPDTPQKYEYITVENIRGQARSMIYIKPWTQFFDLKGRQDVPISYSDNIVMRNIELKCDIFFDVAITEYDNLSNFTLEDLTVDAVNSSFSRDLVSGMTLKNVNVNGQLIE